MSTSPTGHCPLPLGQVPAFPDLEGDKGQLYAAGDIDGVHEVVGDTVLVLHEEALVHHHLGEESHCGREGQVRPHLSFPFRCKDLHLTSRPSRQGHHLQCHAKDRMCEPLPSDPLSSGLLLSRWQSLKKPRLTVTS